jgi:hypothetical protein
LGGTSGLKPYFNPNAFSIAPQYTYGNAERTLNCYGPGFENSDLSINKNFKVGEKANFEVRLEALNALNTAEFGQPGITITPGASSASTGAVTSQLGFSRIIQVGGRFNF